MRFPYTLGTSALDSEISPLARATMRAERPAVPVRRSIERVRSLDRTLEKGPYPPVMKTPLPRSLALLAALTAITGACRRSRDTAQDRAATARNPNAVLDQQAQFAPRAQGAQGPSASDHYELPVGAGERFVVSVESSAFDPILEVVLPDGAQRINDDYQGSRQRAQLTVSSPSAGDLKVRVRSFRPGTGGAYRVRVERQAAVAQVENTNALAQPQHVQNAYQQMGANSTPFLEYIQPSESRTHHRLPPQIAGGVPLRVGQEVQGALAAGDSALPSGESADFYTFTGAQGQQVALAMNSTTIDPYLLVVSPSGTVFADDDSGGTTNAQLSMVLPEAGEYRVIASATRAGAQGAYELKFNPAQRQMNALEWFPGQDPQAPAAPAAVPAATRQGTLAQGDQTLSSGEFVDRYTFNWPVGASVRVRLESSAFDPYVIVRAPSGSQQDNDDATPQDRNSLLEYTVREAGQHTVMVTSYQAGMTGAYRLSVGGATGAQTAPQADPNAPQNAPPVNNPSNPAQNAAAQTVSGELAQGDGTRSSGEFADNFTFNWPAGAAIHLEATSGAFDTYLIVRSPSGTIQQNDDGIQGTTNSALDMMTAEAGPYTVTVSSYRAGEAGAYQLSVRGGGAAATPVQPNAQPTPQPVAQPTPQPVAGSRAREITGTLARGDRTLRTGEFVDTHAMQFRPGEAIRLRLDSSAFDTYLIVRSPSGRQQDNDDLVSGNTNAGIDIPSAEAGSYQVMVTSYQPGMSGAYTLRVDHGAAGSMPTENPTQPIPSPDPNQPTPNPNQPTPTPEVAGGPRVWGVFAGISDYPNSGNDLPECANDAVKLVESLTDRGLLAPERRVLLTDAQATRDNIRQAMQRMAQQAGPQDVFVFFYSGHGGRTQGGSRDGRELDGQDEYLYVYDGQLMDDEMGTLFDGIRARTSILALDSCYAGGFAKDVITRPGRVGLFSSEEDVTSSVAQQFRAGGYLSHFLRMGMAGEADSDPRDNALTVGELTHYVWRQFAQNAHTVSQGEGAYQHLVVDRGAVGVGQVLWNYPRGAGR